jgi:hypothetical protein
VAGQPGDLQGDRVGGDQRGGGHPHQSDDCPATRARTPPLSGLYILPSAGL